MLFSKYTPSIFMSVSSSSSNIIHSSSIFLQFHLYLLVFEWNSYNYHHKKYCIFYVCRFVPCFSFFGFFSYKMNIFAKLFKSIHAFISPPTTLNICICSCTSRCQIFQLVKFANSSSIILMQSLMAKSFLSKNMHFQTSRFTNLLPNMSQDFSLRSYLNIV